MAARKTEIGMEATGWNRVGRQRVGAMVALVLAAVAGSASAATVFKCRDLQGHVR